MLDFQWNFDDAKKVWFQEGESNKAEKIAINMLRKGLSVNDIRDFTELSIDRIKELAKNNLHSEKTTS